MKSKCQQLGTLISHWKVLASTAQESSPHLKQDTDTLKNVHLKLTSCSR